VNSNLKTSEHLEMVSKMLRAFPLEVAADIFKFMQVDLSPGQNIKAHKHAHHAVLYYPDNADPVIVTPEAGTMIYMPPGTVHEVPAVLTARTSIAMLV